eukprot:TRINITY_DN1296_c0_g2_i2.p1 TRINITY_DN1296_c0_g2~~TRINITY_DN1296_c0_g2_i2.p1  ORF type:complete len:164 (-),score=25.06 TRINITY_DN1296_c0_g2_i2:236-727(-)
MYNRDIYPGVMTSPCVSDHTFQGSADTIQDLTLASCSQDSEAKKRINCKVEVGSGITTQQYIATLKEQLQKSGEELAHNGFKPQLVIYNAGTDILDGDPLGCMKVSPDGVKERDEIVFHFTRRDLNVPIVMLTSGGYMKSSARVIADSIKNLASKQLIGLQGP